MLIYLFQQCLSSIGQHVLQMLHFLFGSCFKIGRKYKNTDILRINNLRITCKSIRYNFFFNDEIKILITLFLVQNCLTISGIFMEFKLCVFSLDKIIYIIINDNQFIIIIIVLPVILTFTMWFAILNSIQMHLSFSLAK